MSAKTNMRNVYNEYRHYGEILQTKDFDFTKDGGNYITHQVIKYNNKYRLFVLVNGEVYKIETIRKDLHI